ncbi:ABC transporter permease [uncultured Eubacterium sp.]|uniref:ABC transporter permease n=1 Tax=uncultured Eubacterium sp. TaxID=165185 RepID=UPI002805F5FD|nr:ABC transporter permease [uncultured Eubacterium sp.]
MSNILAIFDAGQMQTVLELGLISSLTVLALFLSYTMLNVCDLSTDGCFTFGAAVGAVVALNGHPILSIPVAMLAGMASGLITALLQTVLGIDSLLAGIVVNTGLYSINIAVMNKSSLLNLNNSDTVFSLLKQRLEGTVLEGKQTLIIATVAVILVVLFLSLFLKTKLGLSIRATGNNPDMVKSSSINPIVTTIIGLCIANAFTALSGCLLAQSQKQAEINIGTGMVTVALASLLIGGVFVRRGKIPLRALGAVLGAIVFRLVYQIAIGLHMPPFMLKLVSSVIVIIAIAGPYLKTRLPEYIRKAKLRSERKV